LLILGTPEKVCITSICYCVNPRMRIKKGLSIFLNQPKVSIYSLCIIAIFYLHKTGK